MKKFLLAMRDVKTRSNQIDVKLVWNPKKTIQTSLFSTGDWLVTTVFSKQFIESKGMEVVYGG